MKNKLFLIFRIIVTFAIILALFKFIPYSKIVEIYKYSYKPYIFLSLGISLACYLLGVSRWKLLLNHLNVNVSNKEIFSCYFSSLFFNLFFPSFIAGDVFRGATISYRYGDTKKVVSSIFMDRFSGGTTLTLMALFATILSLVLGYNTWVGKEVIISVFVLCSIVGGIAVVIFNDSFFLFLVKLFEKNKFLKEKLISVHEQCGFFRDNPYIFFKSLVYSALINILGICAVFIASRAFGVEISILYFFVLFPLVVVVSSIPITIAGIGTRDAAAVYFFTLAGIDKSIGLGLSLLSLISIVLVGIMGGVIYVSIYHRRLQSSS